MSHPPATRREAEQLQSASGYPGPRLQFTFLRPIPITLLSLTLRDYRALQVFEA